MRKSILSIIISVALLMNSCSVIKLISKDCIKSFHEFAYTVWGFDDMSRSTAKVLPPFPWQVEATVPTPHVEGYYVPGDNGVDVVLARSVNGRQEIWVAQRLLAIPPKAGSKTMFTVYQPDLRTWRNISATIGDTEFFATDLFATSDGKVWGKTSWVVVYGGPTPATGRVPVLANLNEHTQSFEFTGGAFETTPLLPDNPQFTDFEILLDKQDVFWILVDRDGIYRYDPTIQLTTKQAELPDLHVSEATLSPEGNIYVKDFRWEKMTKPYFHLYEGTLSQFDPNTSKLVPLVGPKEPWPIFSGMLVTQSGNLWLGSIGYREVNGSWHLLHPNPREFFEHAGDPAWAPPHLMLESSDGLLWYKKFLDMGPQFEGTAWYDPRTGEGCMFTNVAANVIEDSERRLWLVADGKLFKYQLTP